MFDSAPGVHDQAFQLYISMLEGLIVNRWSAAEYLRFYECLLSEISGIGKNHALFLMYRKNKFFVHLLEIISL